MALYLIEGIMVVALLPAVLRPAHSNVYSYPFPVDESSTFDCVGAVVAMLHFPLHFSMTSSFP